MTSAAKKLDDEMSPAAKEVLDKAMALPAESRRRLGEQLLESCTDDSQEEIEREWRDEIMRRIEEVRRGEAKMETLEEVRAHLRAARNRS